MLEEEWKRFYDESKKPYSSEEEFAQYCKDYSSYVFQAPHVQESLEHSKNSTEFFKRIQKFEEMTTVAKSIMVLIIFGILTIFNPQDSFGQSKDSLRCSRAAQEHVKKEIKIQNKQYKKMFVKACYDVSNVVTLVGVRTLLLEDGGEMYYNFIVTVNRTNPKKPFVSNSFSISDKKREELFKPQDTETN